MEWLVLVHVLSAIIGVGPAFFGPVLMRSGQSIEELRFSMKINEKLEFFPKIGGTLAVLSGLCLIWLGNYGSLLQLWLIGSLVLYILIQIIVIAFVAPCSKKVGKWLVDPENQQATALPADQLINWNKAKYYLWAASTFGVLLFVFMIMKPGA